jgi:hypothetical protein
MSWLLGLVFVAAVSAVAALWGRRYFAVRGARLVECPDTHETAAVGVKAVQAAFTGRLDLSDCSRWPEKHDCGRECLAQIYRAPDDCLVRTVVTKWYEGKTCTVCGKALDRADWLERQPGVMDQDGVARPWPDVRPEQLPNVLATQRPVCFDCYVSETFRRQHPELVLDNPWSR